jgi:hypothetical protein
MQTISTATGCQFNYRIQSGSNCRRGFDAVTTWYIWTYVDIPEWVSPYTRLTGSRTVKVVVLSGPASAVICPP